MATPEDIELGLAELIARWPAYLKYEKYYLGDHETRFASTAYRESFGKLIKRLQYNRCSTVVDAFADRLQIESWQDESATSSTDAESKDAIDAWRQIRGDTIAGMIHTEQIKKGDAYLIVWPDAHIDNLPRWRMQSADSCGMCYDQESAEPEYGFKVWRETYGPNKGKVRLTIYAADVLTRFITPGKTENLTELKAEHFIPMDEDELPQSVPNPYGVVPMFHFRNNPDHQTGFGRSELADVVGLQDSINYALWSLMVGMEFTAWPQKVAVGVEKLGEDDDDIDVGVQKWLTVGNALANLYTIPGAPLDPFNATIDEIDALISRTTGVPVHWLGLVSVSSNISGETVKALEAPWTAKMVDRQNSNDAPYSGAMTLDLRIRASTTAESTTAPGALTPIWKSPETRSDMETWSIAQLKKAAGVPDIQIWKEGGYSQEQIEAFTAENERVAQESFERQQAIFARGQDTGFGNTNAAGE